MPYGCASIRPTAPARSSRTCRPTSSVPPANPETNLPSSIVHRPSCFYDAYIFDLDGTVYLGETLLPTAGETIARLRELGRRPVFLSNNPSHTRHAYARRLTR